MLNLKQKLKQNSTDSQIQIAALGVGLRAVFDKYSGMIALVRKWPETDLEELLYGKVEYPHAWKTKYQVINDINTAIERWEKGENVEEGIVFSLSKPNAIQTIRIHQAHPRIPSQGGSLLRVWGEV